MISPSTSVASAPVYPSAAGFRAVSVAENHCKPTRQMKTGDMGSVAETLPAPWKPGLFPADTAANIGNNGGKQVRFQSGCAGAGARE